MTTQPNDDDGYCVIKKIWKKSLEQQYAVVKCRKLLQRHVTDKNKFHQRPLDYWKREIAKPENKRETIRIKGVESEDDKKLGVVQLIFVSGL